jgi:hypothetical protein
MLSKEDKVVSDARVSGFAHPGLAALRASQEVAPNLVADPIRRRESDPKAGGERLPLFGFDNRVFALTFR